MSSFSLKPKIGGGQGGGRFLLFLLLLLLLRLSLDAAVQHGLKSPSSHRSNVDDNVSFSLFLLLRASPSTSRLSSTRTVEFFTQHQKLTDEILFTRRTKRISFFSFFFFFFSARSTRVAFDIMQAGQMTVSVRCYCCYLLLLNKLSSLRIGFFFLSLPLYSNYRYYNSDFSLPGLWSRINCRPFP